MVVEFAMIPNSVIKCERFILSHIYLPHAHAYFNPHLVTP